MRPMAMRALLVAIVAAIMIGLPAVLSRDTEAASYVSDASPHVPGTMQAGPAGTDIGLEDNQDFCQITDPEVLASLISLEAFTDVVAQGVAEKEANGLTNVPDLQNLGNYLEPGSLGDIFEDAGLGALGTPNLDEEFDVENLEDVLGNDYCNLDALEGADPYTDILAPLFDLLGLAEAEGTNAAQASGDGNAAGGPIKFTVNTDVDLPEALALQGDGFCDIAGLGGDGPCTLRAAIQEANALGLIGTVINFDPAFFPPDPQVMKPTIFVNQVIPPAPAAPFCGALGPLPPVFVDDLTIDATGAAVEISGDCDKDALPEVPVGIWAVAFGLLPIGPDNFDFALLGGDDGTLVLSDFTIASVFVCGGFVLCLNKDLDHVEIDNVVINGDMQDLIAPIVPFDIPPLFGIQIIGSNLEDVHVTNNVVPASINAVGTYAFGGLGAPPAPLTPYLQDNFVNISGNWATGGFLGVNSAFIGNLFSKIDLDITGNDTLSSFFPGIGVMTTYLGFSSTDGQINFDVSENGLIVGNEIDVGLFGIGASSLIVLCCDFGIFGTNSHIEASYNLADNDELIGNGNFGFGAGAVATNLVCCGTSDSESTIAVDGNDEINGHAPGGFGIGAWLNNFVCCGDDNVTNSSVSDNGEIDANITGVASVSFAGSVAGPGADDNTSNHNIDGNDTIVGDDVIGVYVASLAGIMLGLDAEQNASNVSVSNNATSIDGGIVGVGVESFAGSLFTEGDENSAVVHVDGNGEITGQDEFGFFGLGVYASSVSGGPDVLGFPTPSSDDNKNTTTVNGNDDIVSEEGPAIGISSIACCGDDNGNNVDISDNVGDIRGEGGLASVSPGIGILVCCSTNVITIQDNEGNITGDGFLTGAGIAILQIDLSTLFIGIEPSNTSAIITGNADTINDSASNGIALCCGLFLGSQIANNVIADNGAAGVGLYAVVGVTVGPGNEITGNGSFTGIEVWNLSATLVSRWNTFTENSIWDNDDLGIDLVGTAGVAAGVGVVSCTPIGAGPNGCLPFPGFTSELLVKDDKLVGGACPECLVEAFIADNDPADQNGTDGPHGEGKTFVGSAMSDADGDFSIELPCGLASGFLTTTNTRFGTLDGNDVSETSEFSVNVPFAATEPCEPPTNTPAPPTDTPVPTTPAPPTDTPVPPTPTNTPTPRPPTPTNTPTEPPKLCGDVNDNGQVNSVDASLILQLKAALISADDIANAESGDVDGDGEITSIDAALILQKDAGLIGQEDLTC